MTDQLATIRRINDQGDRYHAIMLWCPGCEERNPERRRGGLNMLPVSGDETKRPTWKWNGDLVNVTLEPSILCRMKLPSLDFVCHSFLRNGVWEFLNDCTHDLAGQKVPMLPLPEWVTTD